MFWSKNKRKKVYSCKPQFYYIKMGCKGVFVTRTCFRDVDLFKIGIHRVGGNTSMSKLLVMVVIISSVKHQHTKLLE